MKKTVLLLVLVAILTSAFPQTAADYAVQAWAEARPSPPQITLRWKTDPNATGYLIYRKNKADLWWGNLLANLPGTAHSFNDTAVTLHEGYEYRIQKTASGYTGYGYVYAGIEVWPTEHRGTMLLLVDSTHAGFLSPELQRLERDLIGDGWKVLRHDVSPGDSVADVKAAILSASQSDTGLTALFLLGHIPVPYSGLMAPDGHTPDHYGAWPADVYYGDRDNSFWTDNSINNTGASSSRHHNVPGDGKFDNNSIQLGTEWQVGRVDFHNLPAFSKTEGELLKAYLDKDHAYRHKQFTVPRRALIDDNFGAFNGEAFAVNGWRNFPPMFTDTLVVDADYFSTMDTAGYLFSYGCGGGSYTSCSGVGNTNDFAQDSLQSVFTMLFGSYFGDWDSENNFLRAALASGTTLTNCWAGRPHWMMHHMALGETIGYSSFVTQNNISTYHYNFFARYAHVALMGDPSLRLHTVAPPSGLQADTSDFHVRLQWITSTDPVVGYALYRRDTSGRFQRAHPEYFINGLTFTDSCVFPGRHEYMARAVLLETSGSGTYYNLSQGVFDTVIVSKNPQVAASFTSQLTTDTLWLTNTSTGTQLNYHWDFGDGMVDSVKNPVHVYSLPDTYQVSLTVGNSCFSDTHTQTIMTGPVGLDKSKGLDKAAFTLFPNPAVDRLTIEWEGVATAGPWTIRLLDVQGVLKTTFKYPGGEREPAMLDLSAYPAGIYWIEMRDVHSGQLAHEKFVKAQ